MSTPPPSPLLEKWYRRAWIALNAHFDASHSRSSIDRWMIGIAAFLSAIVAAIVGSTIVDASQLDTTLKWIVGISSGSAAGLTTLATQLQYGQKAAAHREAASGYQKIAGHIEQLVLGDSPITDEDVANIRAQIDELESKAPAIPERFRKRFRTKYTPLGT